MKNNKDIATLFRNLSPSEAKEFYDELRFVVDSSFASTSQRITKNVLRRHRGNAWITYVLATIIIGVIIALLVINLGESPNKSSSKQPLAQNESPSNRSTSGSSMALNEDKQSSVVQEASINVEEKAQSEEDKTVLTHKNTPDDYEDMETGVGKKSLVDEANNTETTQTQTQTEANPKTTTEKSNHSGIKFVSSGPAQKTQRDSSVPISLSKAVVSVQQNLWVRENTLSTSGNMNHGQLNEKISTTTATAKFAPEDMPSYHGGNEKLLEHLTYHVSKTQFEKSYDEPVTAVLSFIVNHKGQMEDIKVMYSSTSEIRTAVLNAADELNQWRKGKKIGKKGSVYYEIVLSFK